MSDLYIPPNGLRFRLINKYTNKVIVAKNDVLNDYGGGVIYDDQWFTLEDSEEENKYYIKSTYGPNGGKVIYSKSGGVGIYEKGNADQRMVLEPGTGDQLGSFRIRNDYSTTVLASSAHRDLGNYGANNTKYPDQHWMFLFEDTEIDRVEYHVDKGTISGTGPVPNVMSITLRNEDTLTANIKGHLGDKFGETSSFTYSLGFTITVGAKASFGIPGVASGEITTEYSVVNNFEWGKSTTRERDVGADVETPVPGRMRKEVVGSLNRSTLTVPCTVYSKSKKTGVEVKTEAVYAGTPVWGFNYTIKAAEPID